MSDEPQDPLIGAVVDGTFRITGKIADGGMGTVYRAVDVKLERPVALKMIKPELSASAEFSERFAREAKVMASALHPGLVIVYAFGIERGRHYMALELIEGQSLHELIWRRRWLAPGLAAEIAKQILSALELIHELRIVHRDLKPANVMISERGGAVSVKLLDFGLAKLRRGKHGAPLTDPGIVLGTPVYMAPEQVRGDPIDSRADLYALGIVLYEMLAGNPPFQSKKVFEIMDAHVRTPPPLIRTQRPEVPEELEAIVLGALAKSPAERFQSARAFADALASIAPRLSWADPDARVALPPLEGSPTPIAESAETKKLAPPEI